MIPLELGYAQVDPSSALLLRSGGSAPTKDELDSGRYSIRPGSQKANEFSGDGQQPASTSTKVKVITVEQEEKIEAKKPEEVSPKEEKTEASAEVKSEDDKNMVEDLREILLGGSSEEVDDYLGKVKASDPRNNLVELTLAPFIFYNDSNSTYWYRDYYSYGPGIKLNAKLWLSPFFGISTTYQTGFNSEIRNTPGGTSTEPVDHEWFAAELQFRNYFGVSQKAPSLTFGLGFSEYQMKAKPDSTTRIGVKTAGVKLSVEAAIPVSRGRAWTMGLGLIPRANHKELRTQITPSSGPHDESNVIELSLGRRYTFDRSQVLFWKLQHSFEKNAFKGQASQADPYSNQPENVSVTNSRSLFIFGFTWGH